MADIQICDIESAINWWRERAPSPDGLQVSAPVQALAEIYGRMAFERKLAIDESELSQAANQAWLTWYASTPDAPCIAICSTAQGDAWCKGCGRHESEVQNWPRMSPVEKRAVWFRITREASAWRFNRYAERAPERRA